MAVLGVARHDTELTIYNQLITKSDSQISTKGVGMNRSARECTVKHVEQSQRVDTVLCKHKHAFTLDLFTGAAAARNNFGGPRVNNIKGYFNRFALAYPHFVCLYRLVS